MNTLLLGPQGSGKGTQARLLAEKFNFFYFEAGSFLREIAKTNEKVRNIMAEGKKVADDEMASYIEAFFDEKGIYDNIIFDGFPRTPKQYDFFKNWLAKKNVKLDLAFVLNISEETTIERLSARRQDPQTGKIYNLITDKPPANIDPDKLIQREDDKEEAIKKRLSWYRELTMPLIEELKKSETEVIEINAERQINDIQDELETLIKNKLSK